MPIPFEARLARECLNLRLRRATRHATRLYDDALRPLDLRITQLTLMAAVAQGGDRSLTSLAEVLGLERTSLSRNLRPLERRGLVAIDPEGPRRERHVHLTDRGRELLDAAEPRWEVAQTRLEDRLGREGARILSSLLDGLEP